MKYYDITWPLHEGTPTYPGDPPVQVRATATVERDGFAVHALALGTHTGTHLDAPAHFFAGRATIDQAPLELLCGRARVLDARGLGAVVDTPFLARQGLERVERLLLRTDNERLPRDRGSRDWVGLSADAADFLRDHTAVRLLGIDYLSIEPAADASFATHRRLLGGDPPVWVLEALDLSAVPPGDYDLVCLPLRLAALEAAPARALLVEPRGTVVRRPKRVRPR